MRLIDADTVSKLFDAEFKETIKLICEGETHLDNLAEGFCEAYRVIQNMPTVDAVPVVHGWWLTWEEQFPGRTLRKKSMLGVFCSACHNHADNMFNYCPNCGAKMDLEEEHG
nr:MAG TPA: PROTEIN/RNA Complex, archaeal, ribosomal, 50S, protein.0A [Caudoviricetes sp.]